MEIWLQVITYGISLQVFLQLGPVYMKRECPQGVGAPYLVVLTIPAFYMKRFRKVGAPSPLEPRANNWRSCHWAPKSTTQTKIFCFLWSPRKLLWSLFLPWFCVVVRLRVLVVVFVPSSEASLDRCRQYRSLGPRKTVLRSLLRL